MHTLNKMEEFILVKHLGRKKKGRKYFPICSNNVSIKLDGTREDSDDVDLPKFRLKYRDLATFFAASTFWERTKNDLYLAVGSRFPRHTYHSDTDDDLSLLITHKCSIGDQLPNAFNAPIPPQVSTVITFGLGNFTTSLVSMHQLAFLSTLTSCFASQDPNQNGAAPTVLPEGRLPRSLNYDPCYTATERELLRVDHGQTLLHTNYACGYDLSEFTKVVIAFMPHCEKEHYENLLRANFAHPTLVRLVLICNSFTTINTRTPSRVMRESYPHIYRSLDFVKEVPLAESLYRYNDVFNDLSIHTFDVPGEMLPSDTI